MDNTYFVHLDLPLPTTYGSTPVEVHKKAQSLRSKLQRKTGFKIRLVGLMSANPSYNIDQDFSTQEEAQSAADQINSHITPEIRSQITTKYTLPEEPFAAVCQVRY